MKIEESPKIIPSTGRVRAHCGKMIKASSGPLSRFFFEGEYDNPEQDTRNALITVKDLVKNRIEGTFISY